MDHKTKSYSQDDIKCSCEGGPLLSAYTEAETMAEVGHIDDSPPVKTINLDMDNGPQGQTPDKDKDEKEIEKHGLYFGVEDIPPWTSLLLFGFQQVFVCVSGVISMPIAISDSLCASHFPIVRVKLLGTMAFITGFSTILQSLCGTRLPLLQGPSFAFFPPIQALLALEDFQCPADMLNETTAANLSMEYVDRVWTDRMRIIQGSLVAASAVQMLIGATGLIGYITKFVGPLTIAPLMLLLEISVIEHLCLRYVETHWVSIIVIGVMLSTTLYLHGVKVPIVAYGRKKRCHTAKKPIFALFPYLIAIVIAWTLCAILTVTNVIPQNNVARTDARSKVINTAPWARWPYPGQWGGLSFNWGVFFGFVAATLASVVESVGDYHACARVSLQSPPPAHAVNRGIFMEGFGCFVGGLLGGGSSVTTYSENIGVIGITKVASRRVMVVAGCFWLLFGVFTKAGAVLSTLPDPIIGGVLTISLSMVGGVGLSSIQLIDLKLSRNIAILGLAIMFGLMIPTYIRKVPVNSGIPEIDQIFNILLGIDMFVGGIVGFILDNTVPGATRQERGLQPRNVPQSAAASSAAYSFPPFVINVLSNIPGARFIPLLPPLKS